MSGSGPKAGVLAPEASSLCQPATPIMAALSVAMAWGGISNRVPNSSASTWALARRIGLAATPPTMARAGSRNSSRARRSLAMSTSMQAATNDAATSLSENPGSVRTWLTTAVLSPEKEKV